MLFYSNFKSIFINMLCQLIILNTNNVQKRTFFSIDFLLPFCFYLGDMFEK